MVPVHTALPNIRRDGSHSSSTKGLIHFFCRAFPLVSRNLSQEGSPPLLVSCSRRATPSRQAVLSAVKSFGFTLVYIPQSYLIARTFLPIEFTLSAIYGEELKVCGARAANVPEPRSPTAACAEFPCCPHGHHCFLLGTGCGDLTPFWECHRRKSEEDHGPALGGLPDVCPRIAVVCAMRQGGRCPAFPKQSPFRTNRGLCAKIGLWGGRLVAQQLCLCCKELGAALSCPQEPNGKGTGQEPVVEIWMAEQAPLTGEQVKPSLMTP